MEYQKNLAMHNYLLGKSQTSKSNSFNINYNKKLINDPVEITNIFNDYFSNISSSLVKLLPSASTKFSDYLNSANPSQCSFFLLHPMKSHLLSLKLFPNSVLVGIIFFHLS